MDHQSIAAKRTLRNTDRPKEEPNRKRINQLNQIQTERVSTKEGTQPNPEKMNRPKEEPNKSRQKEKRLKEEPNQTKFRRERIKVRGKEMLFVLQFLIEEMGHARLASLQFKRRRSSKTERRIYSEFPTTFPND